MGISPGKLRLMLILQTLDPSVAIENYKNVKVTDIINEANRLLSQTGLNSPRNGNDAETFEKRGSVQAHRACLHRVLRLDFFFGVIKSPPPVCQITW
jgi:hypothetical protein